MSNIEKLDVTVAKLFAELYEEFPRKVTFSAFDYLSLSGDCSPINGSEIESLETYEQESAEDDFLLDTVSWLIKSGFLYGSIKSEVGAMFISKDCIDLTLTPKRTGTIKTSTFVVRNQV